VQLEQEGAQKALVAAQKSSEAAEARVAEAEEELRQLTERLEGAVDGTATTRLVWLRDQARLLSRLGAARQAGLEKARELAQARLAENGDRLALLRRQLTMAEARVLLTQADLDKIVAAWRRSGVRSNAS